MTNTARKCSLVPAQQTQVAQFAWTDEMSSSKDEPKQHTQRCSSNVGRSQEQRAPSHPGDRGDDNRLGAVEHVHRVV